MWCFDIMMAVGCFFRLWIIVTAVHAAQDVCYNKANGNTIAFNTDESLCCDGRAVNHQNHQFDCFKERIIYDSSKQRVCGDSLYKISSGRYHCFQEREVFDTGEKMDCDGVLNNRREGLVCCSNHTMNASTEVCCPVNGQYLSLSPEACCEQKTGDAPYHLICCGGVRYDDTTHLCCNETLFPMNGTHNCVSDSAAVYDKLTHVLVNNRLEPIVDGKYEVCDRELYNPNHQMCHYQSYEIREIGSASGGRCLGVPYNMETSSCCRGNGTIYHGTPQIPDITACGSLNSEPYLVTDTLDCEGTLYARSPDGQVECCGTEIFNVTEKMCCGGTIVDTPTPTPTTRCCDTSGYDSLTHTCFEEFKIRRGVYSEQQKCGTDVLGDNDFCGWDDMFLRRKIKGRRGDNALCGKTPYNNEKFICSSRGSLFPRTPGMGVCSKSGREVLYDTTEQICCFDRLFPKNIECGQRECCGHKPYTPAYQTCTPSSNIVDIPANISEVCGANVYNTRMEVCDQENSMVVSEGEFRRKPSLCWVDGRPERYNSRSKICCNGVLHSTDGLEEPDCCADTAYDAASPDQICCGHVLHETFGARMRCEGTIAYTEEQQICDGVLYNKTDGECCWSGVYDPQRELCCGNRVKLTKSTETEQCCGTAKYNTTDASKVCCRGKTLHTYLDGYECCGTSLVDPQTSICLNDEFAISRDSEASTCDPSTEDHADGTCCAGLLYVGQFGTCEGLRFIPNEENPLWCGYRLREEGEECCGGSQIYLTSDYTCRGEEVTPLCAGDGYDPTTHSCCNDKIIDNSEKICCSGRVRKIEDGENSCCERVAYNNNTSICCRKTVKRLDDPTTDLNECCHRDQVFSLAHDKCLDRIPQVCSVLSQNKRSKKLVRETACSSTFHGIITVKRSSSSRLEVSVSTRALSQTCPYCEPSSSENRILKRVRTIVLPEECIGSLLPLNQRFLLLDSSIPDTGSHILQLSENARIFSRGAANIVLKTYQDGCS